MDNRVDLPKIKNFRKAHSRTKWGGNRESVGRAVIEGEWYCQICGDKQVKGIDPYLFEAFPGDYLRICSNCFNVVKTGMDTIQAVREAVNEFKRDFLDNQ